MSQGRVLGVVGGLVGGLTVISGALLLLEPSPVDRPAITLSALEDSHKAEDVLFETLAPRAWASIFIADSRGIQGGFAELNQQWRAEGFDAGAGYHFVIRRDGGLSGDLMEISQRWVQQSPGALFSRTGSPEQVARIDQFHGQTIGICLIGDATSEGFTAAQLAQLEWLVQQLQDRFRIPATQVHVRPGDGRGHAPFFPMADFRAHLIP